MNEYLILTCQTNHGSGFVVQAWDSGDAIRLAKKYMAEGWRIFGIKCASGEVLTKFLD